jgi:putative SOS response-associated peptidase YedK
LCFPGVFPDCKAPIVRNAAEGRELATARWGMPSSSKALMDTTKKRAEKLIEEIQQWLAAATNDLENAFLESKTGPT